MNELTLVIPAYNEEKRIKQVLESLKKYFGNTINILVVSNGSLDKTVDILKKWKSKNRNLSYLDFPDKLGKGGAILEGLKKVNTKNIGFIDADDAFDLNYIKKIIENLNNYDCVIASKWKGKNFFNVKEPFVRKVLSRGWNLLVRLLLGLNFYDTQAGAKFFRKEAFDKVSKDFICKDFSFDVELLFKFKRNKFSVKELYVPTIHREGSTYNFREVIPMFINLIQLWWSKF